MDIPPVIMKLMHVCPALWNTQFGKRVKAAAAQKGDDLDSEGPDLISPGEAFTQLGLIEMEAKGRRPERLR